MFSTYQIRKYIGMDLIICWNSTFYERPSNMYEALTVLSVLLSARVHENTTDIVE